MLAIITARVAAAKSQRYDADSIQPITPGNAGNGLARRSAQTIRGNVVSARDNAASPQIKTEALSDPLFPPLAVRFWSPESANIFND